MKITFVLPVVRQNGGSRVVAIHAANLLAMGHDVRVIAELPQSQAWLQKLKRLLRRQPLPTEHSGRTSYFDALADRFVELPRRELLRPQDIPDADVVIATWWRTAFSVAALPPSKGAKVYFVQHHEVHEHLPAELTAQSYTLPLRKITISDWLVDIMARVYGDTNVIKVENSVNFSQFTAPPRQRNAHPRVGFMYSPIRYKGTDAMLAAVEVARHRVPDLEILAFGSKPPTADLPMPPGSEFHLLPPQDQISGLYASCDAWLFGSRVEGFGLPLLEAMACRTPVVATRAGAAPDLIRDGINGYVVGIDDIQALGDRLADVLSMSPEAWRAMSTSAYNKAHSYSWSDASRAFEAALIDIVSQT